MRDRGDKNKFNPIEDRFALHRNQRHRQALPDSPLDKGGFSDAWLPRVRLTVSQPGADGPFFDYRRPGHLWNGDGARAEKIGRRSSTPLHVWSGRADASSSDVP
jgi:hypothetical protein